jgi:hypothetical protein
MQSASSEADSFPSGSITPHAARQAGPGTGTGTGSSIYTGSRRGLSSRVLSRSSSSSSMMTTKTISISKISAMMLLIATLVLLATPALASSGDRNPTFQHCLRGCGLTYCDPSQPPIASYLRAFGWSCEDNCKYECMHSFTDNIRPGSVWHQCECLVFWPAAFVSAFSMPSAG